ncbi:MAG: FecR domain-containing protein [Bacteroidota bacterium]
MQKPSDELIEKFLQSLCTKEEAVRVLEYLKENPGHPYLLSDWDAADGFTPLPANYTQQMFEAVDAAIIKPERKTFSLFWKLAVAASIAGIVISAWVLEKQTSAKPVIASVAEVKKDAWTVKYNTLETDMEMALADGSVVTVSPHASVRYRTDLNSYNKREIYLTGRAFFRVAKNKQKPFVVYTEHLSTTALGTAFCVTAPENTNTLSVKLFEGKVVVAVTDTAYHNAPDYYLTPGQELVFNTNTRQGIIQAFFKKNDLGKDARASMPSWQKGHDESYMFNNQTLADVLDELSAMYHVVIEYSTVNTDNKYFIGKVDRKDSLEKIINDIALLNNLSVTKQNGKFILKKKH